MEIKRFMSFRAWYDEHTIKAKRRAKIIILGSYDAIQKLYNIRNHLRDNGYERTCLVADFEYPPKEPLETTEEYYYRKSTYVMKYGDILLFIFFDNVKNEGLVTELSFTANKLSQKLQFSTVFIEESYQPKLSKMVKGLIKRHKIDYKFFENDDDLKKLALGACSQHLHRLIWVW